MSIPHTPIRHADHKKTPGIPCGCWTGTGPHTKCPLCGAAYNPAEVAEFPVWRCYDCGCGWMPWT